MGIGFVLLIWAVAGTILAGIGALLFGGLTSVLTRKVTRGRRRVIIAAGLLPFACLIWAGALFVFQALVNEGVLHRDPGLGDTWHCPLPNGYALMMIDVTDQGWVYNPKTQPGDGVVEQDDAVAGVRIVQIAGRYIAGGSDTRSFQHSGQNPQGSPQNRPTVVTSKPANGKWPGTRLFYSDASCGGKSVFVRQLRGPHLSTWP